MRLLLPTACVAAFMVTTGVVVADPKLPARPQHTSYSVLKRVPTTQKAVALTIDLGNTASRYSFGQVYGWVTQHDLKVTWFVTGWFIEHYPDLVLKLAQSGQELGNHTNTHPSCPKLSPSQFKQELLTVETMLGRQDLRITPPKYFRPPYGDTSSSVVDTAQSLGYRTVMWSATSEDYDLHSDPREDAQDILDHTKPGTIILCHSTLVSAKVIPQVVLALQAKGYLVVSLGKLVRMARAKQ
ncbi:polysaccharide deacetylase family protein [bacterium]|nr:polysaccharide deacetylase family protein [bacterium]